MNGGFEAVWLYIKALLPPGLSSESEDAIKALLNRIEQSLETD